MNTTCEICGKKFKTTQGLRGHKTFVHQMTNSSDKPSAPLATEQPPGKLEERLQKLENAIGLKEPSELEQLLGITDKPITAQLEQHTHQLTKSSDQLKNLSHQVKIAPSSTEISNISKQLAQLSEQVKRHEGWLTFDPIALLLSKCHHDYPAFLLSLDRLGKQVDDHQGVINWVRKKFNLIKRDWRNPT
jgi:hypothetical protein